jgi:hypothetical protein
MGRPQPNDFREIDSEEFAELQLEGRVVVKASERSPTAKFWILKTENSRGDPTGGVDLRVEEAWNLIAGDRSQTDEDGQRLRRLLCLKADPTYVIVGWTKAGRAWHNREKEKARVAIRALKDAGVKQYEPIAGQDPDERIRELRRTFRRGKRTGVKV